VDDDNGSVPQPASSPGGEFAAIAGLARRLEGTSPPPGEVWIGDDAAVLRPPGGGVLLFSVDSVVAGVHADLRLTGIDDLGWKALAAAVSDIAAMGGEAPRAVVSVAGSRAAAVDLDALYEGLGASAKWHGCPVVGGDLVESPALVVTVAVTGWSDGPPVLRGGARPGDEVWLTRPVGASAAGLRLYRAGEPGAALRRAHARPEAQLAAGRAARRAGATAMIDVSDGLSADLGHLADASGVGIGLDTVPVADGATWEEALGGGEDFALAFCAPDGEAVLAAFEAAGESPPLPIGSCTPGAGELTLKGTPLARSGWQHRW
jgi:thiamine-monophosphate kinase